MNEHEIAAQVRGAQNLARQEQSKFGKVEACDPPMGIATDPKLPAFHDVLCDAEQLVRQKPLWAKFVRGTPLENDVPVWIAEFALRLLQRDRAARSVTAVRLSSADAQFLESRKFEVTGAVVHLPDGATVVCGSPAPQGPCTVCGAPYDKHGSYPTCASHPYTPDGNCQHVVGAACVGAECRNGCVRASGIPAPHGGTR